MLFLGGFTSRRRHRYTVVPRRLVEWEADVLNDRRPEMIAWGSIPGSDIETAGSVHFRALGPDRGTAVTVSMKYNPPAGKVGAAVASLLGRGLEHELAEDLRNFKNVMEAGKAATIQGHSTPSQMCGQFHNHGH